VVSYFSPATIRHRHFSVCVASRLPLQLLHTCHVQASIIVRHLSPSLKAFTSLHIYKLRSVPSLGSAYHIPTITVTMSYSSDHNGSSLTDSTSRLHREYPLSSDALSQQTEATMSAAPWGHRRVRDIERLARQLSPGRSLDGELILEKRTHIHSCSLSHSATY